LMLLVLPSRIWNLIEAVRNGVLALKWLGNMFNLLLVSRTSLLHSVRTILFGSNPCNGPSSTWTFHVWNIWVIEFGIPMILVLPRVFVDAFFFTNLGWFYWFGDSSLLGPTTDHSLKPYEKLGLGFVQQSKRW
jgi:hypothetical protein